MTSLRLVLLLLAVLAAGCVKNKVVCDAPQESCDDKTCTSLDSDPANCGACGVACGASQSCVRGACVCTTGATDCGGACVDTASVAAHCGACGRACPSGQLCQSGACVPTCAAPATACGSACVDVTTSASHCGACDHACAQGQDCVAGACRASVFAACFNTGELVALDKALVAQAQSASAGGGPQAMGAAAGTLYVGDGIDSALYAFDPTTAPPQKRAGADALGTAFNQVVVQGSRAYAINSLSNSIQVLDLSRLAPQDRDSSRTVAEIPTALGGDAQNTNPSFGAILGDKLYVTLMGACTEAGAAAGGKVLEIDLAASTPAVTREAVFAAADFLKDAGAADQAPRPSGIAARAGKLYVAIGNLAVSCMGPAGPGYLSIVDAASLAAHHVKLPDECRNPYYVVASDTRVYVSCAGSYGWGMGIEEALVVLDRATEQVVRTTTFGRCAASDPADGPNACKTAVPGRMAIVGDRLVIGDSNAGRLLVTDLDGAVAAGFEDGLRICPLKCLGPNDTGCYQFVSDVFAMP